MKVQKLHCEQTCRKCGKVHDRLTRFCEECGYAVIPKEEFYPALWSYGCPRHEDCRAQMTFADDRLQCSSHGGSYRTCEIDDEAVRLSETLAYNAGIARLEHVSGDVDEKVDHYTIMSCPDCDPSGHNCEPGGLVGDPCYSLYMRRDKEGRGLSASCRACGLDYDEYLARARSEDDDKGAEGPEKRSDMSVKIDYLANKVAEAESLIESSVTLKTYRDRPTPRWLELTVGLLSLSLSGSLALGGFGFSTSIVDGTVDDWQSFVALTVIMVLSTFFAMVSYRLLLGRLRSPSGYLLSPTFMIAFGILMSTAGTWILIVGEGDWLIVLFGLASLSAGLARRKRSGSARLNEPPRPSGKGATGS